jgi:uncharacterized membrane protein (DUF485 family)
VDDKQGADYRLLKRTLRNLLQQPKMMTELQSEASRKQAMDELRINSEDVCTDILDLINEIDLYSDKKNGLPLDDPETTAKKVEAKEINSAKLFFERAFEQLQRAYKTSIFMSLTMFVVGVGFLILAAYQAIVRPDNVTTTSVIGGIGIIQIVTLFYRNPLADIARSVSNAQQAKVAITSYLIGITLIHDSIIGTPTERHLQSLLQVTDKALGQLQEYTEDHHISERTQREKR